MNIFVYIIWIAIVIVVAGIGCAYIGWRFIAPLNLTMPRRRYAWLAWVGVFLVVIGSMVLFRAFEEIVDPLSWVVYVMLGFLSFVFTFLLIRDLLYLSFRGIRKLYLFTRKKLQSYPARQTDLDRRGFLLQMTNLGIVGLSASLTGYGIYEARRKPGIVNVAVPIHRLPKAFDGFKILQITDIHAGLTVKRDWIETIVAEVHELQPDLIAFTGDLADGSVPYLRNDVSPLAELRAPYGKFFVTGNHEYYSGVEQWVEEVQRLGYDILINQHRLIRRNGASLVLAGVTDYTGGQFLPSHKSDPQAALRNAPPEMAKILLAHQPRSLLQAESLGLDLIISGHTHGGQFFPWNLVAALGQPFIKGLHNHNGTRIYVSKGTGYWGPPVRLGARSEITVITLTQ